MPPTLRIQAEPGTPETKAARDLLAERYRQVNIEGFIAEHDDEHIRGELAEAAAAYAWAADSADIYPVDNPPDIFPWDPMWWKPCDRRQMLVKAGALILAEIERLDRMGYKKPARKNPFRVAWDNVLVFWSRLF